MLIAYVYGPVGGHLHDAARFIVLPVLALTGIAMWKAPRIRRLRRTLSRTRALAPRGRVEVTPGRTLAAESNVSRP